MKKLIAAALVALIIAMLALSACGICWICDRIEVDRRDVYDAGFDAGIDAAIECMELWIDEDADPRGPVAVHIELFGQRYEHIAHN